MQSALIVVFYTKCWLAIDIKVWNGQQRRYGMLDLETPMVLLFLYLGTGELFCKTTSWGPKKLSSAAGPEHYYVFCYFKRSHTSTTPFFSPWMSSLHFFPCIQIKYEINYTPVFVIIIENLATLTVSHFEKLLTVWRDFWSATFHRMVADWHS